MLIYKDSSQFRRAVEKSYRLLPEMFKTHLSFRYGLPVVSRRVVGSRSFVYSVRIWSDGVSCFDAVCNCAAGKKEIVCYHVAAVYSDFERNKINGNIYSLNILPFAFGVPTFA